MKSNLKFHGFDCKKGKKKAATRYSLFEHFRLCLENRVCCKLKNWWLSKSLRHSPPVFKRQNLKFHKKSIKRNEPDPSSHLKSKTNLKLRVFARTKRFECRQMSWSEVHLSKRQFDGKPQEDCCFVVHPLLDCTRYIELMPKCNWWCSCRS